MRGDAGFDVHLPINVSFAPQEQTVRLAKKFAPFKPPEGMSTRDWREKVKKAAVPRFENAREALQGAVDRANTDQLWSIWMVTMDEAFIEASVDVEVDSTDAHRGHGCHPS